MKEKDIHLNEDQVLLSLVDQGDLSEEMRNHLGDCKTCRDKRASLLLELESLGKMAGGFTPEPLKRPALPGRKPGRKRFHVPVFATGLASAALVVFLCGIVFFSGPTEQIKTGLSMNSEIRLHMMEDILEESALSGHYLDITQTSHSYFDDEFLEFMIPLEESSNALQGFSFLSFKA